MLILIIILIICGVFFIAWLHDNYSEEWFFNPTAICFSFVGVFLFCIALAQGIYQVDCPKCNAPVCENTTRADFY